MPGSKRKPTKAGSVAFTLALGKAPLRKFHRYGVYRTEAEIVFTGADGTVSRAGISLIFRRHGQGKGRQVARAGKGGSMIVPSKIALRAGLALAAALLCLAALFAASAGARTLEVPSFVAPGLKPDLSPSTVPGGRPYELINTFILNQTPTLEGIAGAPANIRDLSFELPPGFVANRAGFPRCTAESFAASACATANQVGVADLVLSAGVGALTVPVFNLMPPAGLPAQFGFRAMGSAVHIDFRLRAGSDYGVTASVSGLSAAAGVLSSTVRIWGVPGDAGHDAERFTGSGASAAGPYPEAPPFKPLLSNPTSCNGPLITTMEATTWQHPGEPIFAAPFEAPGGVGCNQLDFNPAIEAKPTTNLADSPSGLDFHLHIPQIQDPEGSASAQLRSARIVLPAGLVVNPAAANGLGTCSEQQIGPDRPLQRTPAPALRPAPDQLLGLLHRQP